MFNSTKSTGIETNTCKRWSLIVALLIALQMTACNSKEKEVIVSPAQTKVAKRENGAAKDIFSPAFNILFLRNYNSKPDSNQLEMFLTKLNNKPPLVVCYSIFS